MTTRSSIAGVDRTHRRLRVRVSHEHSRRITNQVYEAATGTVTLAATKTPISPRTRVLPIQIVDKHLAIDGVRPCLGAKSLVAIQ